MQKHVNLVDLVKSFPTNIFLQNLASMQKRTSPIEFARLAEKSEKSSISTLSTKVRAPQPAHRATASPPPGSTAQRASGPPVFSAVSDFALYCYETVKKGSFSRPIFIAKCYYYHSFWSIF